MTRKKTMYGDIWWTYCVDHFTIYMMHILNHCFIPETNIMFYVNYISIGKKKSGEKDLKMRWLIICVLPTNANQFVVIICILMKIRLVWS